MATGPRLGADTMNAPWGLASRLKLALLACEFFKATKLAESHAAIGKELPKQGNPAPLSAQDFLNYLEVVGAFAKTPNALRVAQMLERMGSAGLLVFAGHGGRGFGGLGNHYLYMPMEWEALRGHFRLVPALGAEFLYHLCAPGLVHITGTNGDGDAVAGTGLVVHPSHVLTCRHVVSGMKVDERQTFQGKACGISEDAIHEHADVDIAVIRVDGPALAPLQGAMFQAPVVAQTVYTLGYPKLPRLRDASVVMQPGAVTNEAVTSLGGESLFLYSAIARPGNSGGPVMSDDGYVVGLCTEDVSGEYDRAGAFSPHYAGIPAQVVVEAVASLGLDIQLPFERYE